MSWLSKLFGGGAPRPATPSFRCDGATARKLVAAGAQFLDVRTGVEHRQGHIPGSLNIPVDELSRRLDEVATDRPVVVYCRSGARSARAVQLLRGNGLTDLHDLGPMTAW
ncbi:rhodanese-like domain-containing protein [Myxococcota bacterium]|nr:rhodanese-like domain-containing protein [Myxococcota bacterium]